MTYSLKVYHRQGDGAMVVESAGAIVVKTGGKIVPNSETQASHIANATGGITTSAAGTGQAKINSILSALRGVGILATSYDHG
jgi:hypothetical protein